MAPDGGKYIADRYHPRPLTRYPQCGYLIACKCTTGASWASLARSWRRGAHSRSQARRQEVPVTGLGGDPAVMVAGNAPLPRH
ncbi:MAG: hypothetical protein U0401_06310 [Anaerolineae bacterium]